MEEQIERLRKEFNENEIKLRKQFDEECKLLDENYEKEIKMERNYMENCLEIEIGKLKEEIEMKIELLNKNRYQSLQPSDNNMNNENNEAISIDSNEQYMKKIDEELQKERMLYEEQCLQRRKRFDEQMKLFTMVNDQKRIEWLKKEIIPLIQAKDAIRITDETILETRFNLKFIRNAIKSGQSWALYRGQYQQHKNVVCRVTVLSKLPNEIRMNIDHSTKCQRFLYDKQQQQQQQQQQSNDQQYFIKLYDIFLTEQKMYAIFDEYEPITLSNLIQYNQQLMNQSQLPPKRSLSTKMKTLLTVYNDTNQLRRWFQQLCDALIFMHQYAIAHLNIRLDNIIFDEKHNLRLIGFSRAFCYFNLDQERFLKCKRFTITNSSYYDHLPPECFQANSANIDNNIDNDDDNDNFDPLRADIWSYGLLLYETITNSNPRKLTSLSSMVKQDATTSTPSAAKQHKRSSLNQQQQQQQPQQRSSLRKLLLDRNLKFNYDKIQNESLKQLLSTILENINNVYSRPSSFNEIRSNEYFQDK